MSSFFGSPGMFPPPPPRGDLEPPAAEQVQLRESGHFLSFAKRSRTVQRCTVEPPPCPPSFLQPKASIQYNQEFWDRILQWPSSLQTEASAVRVGGEAERRLRRGQGVEFGKDSLPTPSELIRRRRVRGGRVGGAQRGDVMQQGMATVLQHISDLKRRQSSIDQLKTERCWGFMAGRGAEEVGGARPADLLLGQRPPDPRTGTASFTTNLPLQNQQIFGGGSDVMPSLAPGENPMMSFVMATANRQPHRGVCSPQLSHTEFWGFGSEE